MVVPRLGLGMGVGGNGDLGGGELGDGDSGYVDVVECNEGKGFGNVLGSEEGGLGLASNAVQRR